MASRFTRWPITSRRRRLALTHATEHSHRVSPLARTAMLRAISSQHVEIDGVCDEAWELTTAHHTIEMLFVPAFGVGRLAQRRRLSRLRRRSDTAHVSARRRRQSD